MILIVAIDLVSGLLLFTCFILVWKKRKEFHSMALFLPAALFLAFGRVSDIIEERSEIQSFDFKQTALSSWEIIITLLGNLFDVIGILFLIVGFLAVMKIQREEQKRIKNLELLLPLCAGCKKFRRPDGTWHPIEAYLIESGSPQLTHGLCPECSEKFFGAAKRQTS
ncbi:MAG: hypothetical protein WAV76_06545 [Bacteroidota bacterium]